MFNSTPPPTVKKKNKIEYNDQCDSFLEHEQEHEELRVFKNKESPPMIFGITQLNV